MLASCRASQTGKRGDVADVPDVELLEAVDDATDEGDGTDRPLLTELALPEVVGIEADPSPACPEGTGVEGDVTLTEAPPPLGEDAIPPPLPSDAQPIRPAAASRDIARASSRRYRSLMCAHIPCLMSDE